VNFRTGVFDGNSAAPTLGPFAVGAPASHSYNRYGVDFHLNPSRGLIFLNEFAFDFLKNGAPEIPANSPGGLFFGPGHIAIGGFYASNQFENIYQAELQTLGVLEPPERVGHIAGDYGVYAIWEQKFYEDAPESPNGLFLFGRGLREPFTKEFFDGKKIPKIRLASVSPTITSAIECGMQTRLLGVRASREF
jgi:Carbohydrate-selective porin, OprB family